MLQNSLTAQRICTALDFEMVVNTLRCNTLYDTYVIGKSL